jgi:DNA-binding NarL/FixJ family response regulator
MSQSEPPGPRTTPYRIVLADDHVILRQGLRRLIEAAAGLEVIGEANDGLDLLELLERLAPDLVILDISMPRLRGIEAIHEVRALRSEVKVLVLTMHKEPALLKASVSAGANGYVLKEDAETHLFAAIDSIRRGGTYVSPRLSDPLTVDWARTSRSDASRAGEGDRLTVREREVLTLTAEGKSNREISGLLGISTRTVEHHRAHILSKLSLNNTADIVRYALHQGYVNDGARFPPRADGPPPEEGHLEATGSVHSPSAGPVRRALEDRGRLPQPRSNDHGPSAPAPKRRDGRRSNRVRRNAHALQVSGRPVARWDRGGGVSASPGRPGASTFTRCPAFRHPRE